MVNSWQNFTPWAFWNHFISAPQAKNLRIKNKKVLITGGNGGIGRQTALACAREGASKVVICARNETTGNSTVEEMKRLSFNGDAEFKFVKLDLGDQEQTKQVAEELSKDCDFDVVILNAGVLNKTKKVTKDGFEAMFGINHLGHHTFLLTYLNSKTSKTQFPKRVVTLGSIGHVCKDLPFQADRGMNFDDLNFEKTEYNVGWAYGQSKLGPMLFAKSLSEKFPEMTVNTMHPGWVRTELFTRDMGMKAFNTFLRSPENGCQTILHLGFSEDVKKSGKYWENCTVSESNLTKFGKSTEQRVRLWEKSVELTGVSIDERFR